MIVARLQKQYDLGAFLLGTRGPAPMLAPLGFKGTES